MIDDSTCSIIDQSIYHFGQQNVEASIFALVRAYLACYIRYLKIIIKMEMIKLLKLTNQKIQIFFFLSFVIL